MGARYVSTGTDLGFLMAECRSGEAGEGYIYRMRFLLSVLLAAGARRPGPVLSLQAVRIVVPLVRRQPGHRRARGGEEMSKGLGQQVIVENRPASARSSARRR
jgi:hypothetical protein